MQWLGWEGTLMSKNHRQTIASTSLSMVYARAEKNYTVFKTGKRFGVRPIN